jgi:hypothetical protein
LLCRWSSAFSAEEFPLPSSGETSLDAVNGFLPSHLRGKLKEGNAMSIEIFILSDISLSRPQIGRASSTPKDLLCAYPASHSLRAVARWSRN